MTGTVKRPDFSATMLKEFLRLRIAMMAHLGFPATRRDAETGARADIVRMSGVTQRQLRLAISGRLTDPVARTRIWAALWADPAEFGIRLTDDGGQEGGDAG